MAASAGSSHTVAVGADGSLFVWGRGERGRLGTGDTDDRTTPTRLAGLPSPVRQVAAGYDHTGIVTDAGDLLLCGLGWHGPLGLGDQGHQTTPTLVERALFDGEGVMMVACGKWHTAALTEGGGVYTFGSAQVGQLGHGDEEGQLAPRRVPAALFNGERVVMVAAGSAHIVALSEEGHVYTWGRGWSGQLGHNDEGHQWVPRQVERGRFGGEKMLFVAAGANHTFAVTARGRLYTWGCGGFGQLGHGENGNRLVPTLVGAGAFGGAAVVMAACGDEHSLVVTSDGALWASGQGCAGQLGLHDQQNRFVFERIGAGEFGGARIVAAAAGAFHSAAVTEGDGTLWTWGGGQNGKLGHGNWDRRLVPTLLAGGELGGGRVGRCWRLSAEHALAFAMGTHGRLGAASPVRCLAGEVELLRMIAGWCRRWVGGAAGRAEGLVRLLGGGANAGVSEGPGGLPE